MAGSLATEIPDPAGGFVTEIPGSGGLPTVTDEASWNTIAPGSEFIDPEGKKRFKPYEVTDAATFEKVPEGAQFRDPEGNLRTKPIYDGVDFTTQTLYDMALTDKERFNALARAYGKDNVKRDEGTGEYYIEKDELHRIKPGAGNIAKRGAAFITSQALPAGLSAAGAIGGGTLGSAVPGAGTVAGAAAGGGAGAVMGQTFNDMILQLAGVYERTPEENLVNLGTAGLVGTGGAGVGRGLATLAPVAGNVVTAIGAAGPRIARGFLGAAEDDVVRAYRLAESGARVPPSSVAKEAPALSLTVEQFDPAFRKQNVIEQAAEGFYEKEAGKILRELGAPLDEGAKLTQAAEPVAMKEVGEALIEKARKAVEIEDARLNEILAKTKAEAQERAQAGGMVSDAQLANLRAAEQSSREAAQKAIDDGFRAIDQDIRVARKGAGIGEGGDGLWTTAASKIRSLNAAVKARASKMYSQADELAGDIRPALVYASKEGDQAVMRSLQDDARAFMADLPDEFQGKYPEMIRKLTDLEAGAVTFGQLRNLRSMIRSDIDWQDMTGGMKAGSLKYFAGRIDDVLRNTERVPELKPAVEMLNKADAFYAKNMPRFRDKVVQGMIDALASGMPPDAEALAAKLLVPNQSARIHQVRKMVGKPVWNAVLASDMQSMMNASKTLIPGEFDALKFAKEVLDRVQDGIFDSAYSPEMAAKLRRQAQAIMANSGKLPIARIENETVAEALTRAESAANAIKVVADRNPLGVLEREVKDIEKAHAEMMRGVKAQRDKDSLAFLTDPTTGGIEAAQKIIRNPDLLLAASNKFGPDSPEFAALRQSAVRSILQRQIGTASKLEKELAEKISPEAQQLLFPGVALHDMRQLAKDMNFLLGGLDKSMGGGIAATERVTHPLSALGSLGKMIPGPLQAAPVARAALAWYYRTVSDMWSGHIVKYLAKGLKGGPDAREFIRKEVSQEVANILTGGGAGGSMLLFGRGDGIQEQKPLPYAPPRRSWQEEYQQRYGR